MFFSLFLFLFLSFSLSLSLSLSLSAVSRKQVSYLNGIIGDMYISTHYISGRERVAVW